MRLPRFTTRCKPAWRNVWAEGSVQVFTTPGARLSILRRKSSIRRVARSRCRRIRSIEPRTAVVQPTIARIVWPATSFTKCPGSRTRQVGRDVFSVAGRSTDSSRSRVARRSRCWTALIQPVLFPVSTLWLATRFVRTWIQTYRSAAWRSPKYWRRVDRRCSKGSRRRNVLVMPAETSFVLMASTTSIWESSRIPGSVRTRGFSLGRNSITPLIRATSVFRKAASTHQTSSTNGAPTVATVVLSSVWDTSSSLNVRRIICRGGLPQPPLFTHKNLPIRAEVR